MVVVGAVVLHLVFFKSCCLSSRIVVEWRVSRAFFNNCVDQQKHKRFSNGHIQFVVTDWIEGIWAKSSFSFRNEGIAIFTWKWHQKTHRFVIIRFGFGQLFMIKSAHLPSNKYRTLYSNKTFYMFRGKCNLLSDWSAGLIHSHEDVAKNTFSCLRGCFRKKILFLNDNATLVHQICGWRMKRAREWERKCDMTEVFYYASCVSHRYDNLKHFTFIILIGWIIAFANIYVYFRCHKMCVCCTVEHWKWKRMDRDWMASVATATYQKANQFLNILIFIFLFANPPSI